MPGKKKRLKIAFRIGGRVFSVNIPFFDYLLENWGAPFVVGFMVLLSVAAGCLAFGDERFAEVLAEYAYYFLVVGVLLQTASYIYWERKKG